MLFSAPQIQYVLTLEIKIQYVAGGRANKIPWRVNRIRYKSWKIMLLCCKALVRLQVERCVPCWTWRLKKKPSQTGCFDPWKVGRILKLIWGLECFSCERRFEQLCMLSLVRYQVWEELIMVSKCLQALTEQWEGSASTHCITVLWVSVLALSLLNLWCELKRSLSSMQQGWTLF